MSEARVASCIFCDDVRSEVGNKFSLMGIYAGEMLFPSPPPIIIPKFGIFASLITDIGDEPDHIVFRVLIPPEQSELMKLEMDKPTQLEHLEGATKTHIRAVLLCPPFNFIRDGFIEVTVDTGREIIRAGRIFLRSVSQPDVAGIHPQRG